MLSYNELKAGTIFTKNEDPDPYEVLEYAFIRMQQRKPVTQLKIKNLLTGKVQDYAAHQNESFYEVEIERQKVNFIYRNNPASTRQAREGEAGGEYWFHEVGKPGNRFSLADEAMGDAGQYLKANAEVTAFKFGEKIINIELPVKVDLKVTEAPPAIRGDTAQGGTKSVTLETGAKANVPLFINEGDVVRVNTVTGEYVERVEKA
ncbi:MAG: hypothetical protein V1696_00985 [Candidatus Jorgensenbacteria bacterium]